MKVLLIHQAFVSPRDAGGTRHFELAQFARKRGHQVVIIASDLSYLSGNRHPSARGLVSQEEIDGVKVFRAYTYPSLHRSFAWRVISFLSFMVTSVWAGLRAGPVDLVMGTSPPIFQAISAWLVSVLRRKPFLLEIRDLWPDFAVGMGVLRNPMMIAASRCLERFLYHQADHIVVNSPAYRDLIIRKGIPAEKLSLIPNGVDPEMFDPDSAGAAARLEWGLGDALVVLYAGALGQANDIPTILRAAQHLREDRRIRWVFAGDGKERKSLEDLAAKLGIRDGTLFTGALPKSRMKELMAAADICVATLQNIPMFRTTYPNKVFDYMAAGRPTVLGIDGVIRDVIESAGGGIFVPPGNDLALARAVEQLTKDKAARVQMGRAARSHVTKHFHRHDQAAQFIDLIQRIAAGIRNPSTGHSSTP
jgi:glycosyltransferase involved in cell wall biosynthesis